MNTQPPSGHSGEMPFHPHGHSKAIERPGPPPSAPRRLRMAILVSRREHCLAHLLQLHRRGELRCEIPLIISNHLDLQPLAAAYGIPFRHVSVQRGSKHLAEAVQLGLLHTYRVDFIALARYMQVLSAGFVRHYENRIINIHHSLLPAFAGSHAYQRAHDRGVKIIGATAHYVTEALDDGPIIEQDAIRVSHRDSVQDLMRKGAHLENKVLARAIKWHIGNQVMVHLNRTLVFDYDQYLARSLRDKEQFSPGGSGAGLDSARALPTPS